MDSTIDKKILIIDNQHLLHNILNSEIGIEEKNIIVSQYLSEKLDEVGVIFLNSDIKNTFAICRKLKRNKKTQSLPVVFFNYRDDPEVIKTLNEHRNLPNHADYYLFPPISAQKVRNILERIFNFSLKGTKKEAQKPTKSESDFYTPYQAVHQESTESSDFDIDKVSNIANYITSIQKEFYAIQSQLIQERKQHRATVQELEAKIAELEKELNEKQKEIEILKEENNRLKELEYATKAEEAKIEELKEKLKDQEELFKRLEDGYQVELKNKDLTIQNLLSKIEGLNKTSDVNYPEISSKLKAIIGELNEIVSTIDGAVEFGVEVQQDTSETNIIVQTTPESSDDFEEEFE